MSLQKVPGFVHHQTVHDIDEFVLRKNGLRVLYQHRPGTATITTNLTYFVGSRDEVAGETGLAHMLEHMMFKPTVADRRGRHATSRSMRFEQSTGVVLNANTWKDRTTYYFSYPTVYFIEALTIEAERMRGVVLTPDALGPEQQNVLSEFDMYNGDPSFALEVALTASAFQSHPYRHETIGFRADIAAHTTEMLQSFYDRFYRPDNAILMIIGDIERGVALKQVRNLFEPIENPPVPLTRRIVIEPPQEGVRRTTVQRPSTTNLLAIGRRHAAFTHDDWFVSAVALEVLAGGPESLLHRRFVDTGKAVSVSYFLMPSREAHLAHVSLSLAPQHPHAAIEAECLAAISDIDGKTLKRHVEKVKMQMLTSELFDRTHSLSIASELTEYVSAGDWTRYFATPDILTSITPAMVRAEIARWSTERELTIGTFIGTTRV